MSDLRLIVGLGNPGRDYVRTRHNLGFLVVERIAEKLEIDFKNCSFAKAVTASGKAEDKELTLLLPATFMNLSGQAVKPYVAKKAIPVENILVVCDDLDLEFGQLRLRTQGSAGGHNGLDSIIEHLNTREFARLRLGISRPSAKKDTVEYVLEKFNKSETALLEDFIDEAAECCLVWVKDGIKKGMDQFNRRNDNGKK